MRKKQIERTELEKRWEAELAAAAETGQEQLAPEEMEKVEAEEVAPEVDVAALLSERDDLNDKLLRARADFDNYRKRVAREEDRIRKTAAQGILRDLLPVVDNLERALDHAEDGSEGFAQGVEMVHKQLGEVLRRHGLAAIPTVGHPFDPNVHEALMCIESAEHPPEHVAQEFQKGYKLGSYVLRPAKVVVTAAAEPAVPEPPRTENENEIRSEPLEDDRQ